MLSCALRSCGRGLAPALLALALGACGGDPAPALEPYEVTVMMPMYGAESQPDLEWAAQKINLGGGIDGHELVLDYRPVDALSLDERLALAESLAADEAVKAVITGGGSDELLAVMPLFFDAQKPVLSATEAAGELLRAFNGSPYLWRTKLNDMIQVEFIIRDAEDAGVASLALLSSHTHGGQTFFDWFGFYALDMGYGAGSLTVGSYAAGGGSGDQVACEAELDRLLADAPELLIVAATSLPELDCALEGLDARRLADGSLPTRVVLADLGLNSRAEVERLGEVARGVEGWAGGTLEAEQVLTDFEKHAAEAGGGELPWAGISGHDAVLLVGYGLQREAVTGGTLAEAIAEVVHGRESAVAWDAEGVADGLARLRAGELPDINGATGPLTYDPLMGVDVVEGALSHWTFDGPAGEAPSFAFDYDVLIGEGGAGAPRFHDEASEEAYEEPDELVEGFAPATPEPTRTKALIIAASPGWENYRHQADALARYQLLKANGFDDGDIVMIGADDIANAADNALPGVVRNVPGGPDVYAGVSYDYDLSLSPERFADILLGNAGADLPEVLELDEGTNLYIYLAGHGGLFGVGFGAGTAEQALSGAQVFWEPAQLLESLCTLRAEGGVRRVFIEAETCHGGVYGDADFLGIEQGCDGGATPLTGVLAITAANTLENSLGAGWDTDLHQWVGDEFSVAMLTRISLGSTDLSTLYRDVYLSVAGSHVSLYNAAHYGELYEHGLDEFLVQAP